MPHSGRCVALFCLTFGWALAGRAAAVAPEVKDDGKFFSADAVKKANEQVRELFRKYDRDLLFETFATVPADQAEKVKEMSSEERSLFFKKWAEQRMREAVVNGVYVLVTRQPAHIRVEVSAKARSAFGERDIPPLVQLLVEKFRAKQFDEGLLDAVKFVGDKMAAARREPARNEPAN
jgi:hypothetical protein